EQVAESEERPVRQGQDDEITTVLPVKQLVDEGQVSKEVDQEVIPSDVGLAMTDKDTAAEENASHIAPLKKKKRTKRDNAVRQASADVSASDVPEPTASAIEKKDQDEEAGVSRL
ncbi:hypothetical protein A2U01_0055190, partial [Trifolium medium]|nr:hypothetical protein [Trifolium medium]